MTRTLSLTLAALLLTATLALAPTTAEAQSVTIETTKGNIVVELNAKAAPITVANFLEYVKAGFFSKTIFHRVIKGFMIQGGGLTADMNKKSTRAAIKLEANNGLKNDRGTIAMARTGAPHSATAQFFINHKDNAMLNAKGDADGYAVFGKVMDIKSMAVVDAIANTKTTRKNGRGDVPVELIEIKGITINEAKKPAKRAKAKK
jgi:cyclophilin family peptidyl-prolyl cis-trans isomerase